MTPTKISHPTIEQLAEEFLQRYRRGERPALAEYTTRYPELADDIRDVFAALVLIEEAGPQDAGRPAAFRGQVTADGKIPQEIIGSFGKSAAEEWEWSTRPFRKHWAAMWP